jgi:hypothetical protein
MKAQAKNVPPNFIPRTIELTFETQSELDAFGALFNICSVNDTLNSYTGCACMDKEIRAAVRETGGDCTRFHAGIRDGIRRA